MSFSVGIADAAAWEVALEHIRDVSLIKKRIEEMRHQNASPEDAERIEKRLGEVRTRMNNLVKIGMAAQDEEVLASVTQELHLLETEKRGLQAMLAEVAEDEETASLIEAEIHKFEVWVEKVRPLLADPSYQPSYEEKRLACLILGIQAIVWPLKTSDHRLKVDIAPPSIMKALLCLGNNDVEVKRVAEEFKRQRGHALA